MQGYIHSIESFGTVDGPGVRYVVFFQGCPMRCLYCHNPDTWEMNAGKKMTVEEIIASYMKKEAFYHTGGITATGGEPMMQLEFLTELFEEAKRHNIHTCLDTSGVLFPVSDREEALLAKIRKLLEVTDLVMLDIKHMDAKMHTKLTGHSQEHAQKFLAFLQEMGKKVWIRHVVVPTITFDKKEIQDLGIFLKKFDNIEKVELLPYHSMGEVKYDALGIEYPLKGIAQLTKQEKELAVKWLNG